MVLYVCVSVWLFFLFITVDQNIVVVVLQYVMQNVCTECTHVSALDVHMSTLLFSTCYIQHVYFSHTKAYSSYVKRPLV